MNVVVASRHMDLSPSLREHAEKKAQKLLTYFVTIMAERLIGDKALRCSTCGDGFVFSSGEQELFRLRGITSEPAQCPNCARGQVLASPARRGGERRST